MGGDSPPHPPPSAPPCADQSAGRSSTGASLPLQPWGCLPQPWHAWPAPRERAAWPPLRAWCAASC
eukprot:1240254-Alexandrium_andersonii.AAC.1